MRPSAERHVLPLLRQIIGPVEQWRLADLAGCSEETIRKVEKGKRPLSRDLAAKIALATNVSEEWLLDNDRAVPPFKREGGQFTREVYDQHRASLRAARSMYTEARTPYYLFTYYEIMRCVLARLNHEKETMAFYRIEEFLRSFVMEFIKCSLVERIYDDELNEQQSEEQTYQLIGKDLASARKLADLRSGIRKLEKSPLLKSVATEVRGHLHGLKGHLHLPR